jgi:hypothetical protein
VRRDLVSARANHPPLACSIKFQSRPPRLPH